jgi:hypothetical protein
MSQFNAVLGTHCSLNINITVHDGRCQHYMQFRVLNWTTLANKVSGELFWRKNTVLKQRRRAIIILRTLRVRRIQLYVRVAWYHCPTYCTTRVDRWPHHRHYRQWARIENECIPATTTCTTVATVLSTRVRYISTEMQSTRTSWKLLRTRVRTSTVYNYLLPWLSLLYSSTLYRVVLQSTTTTSYSEWEARKE